jgi:hypothetical protein
VISPKRYPGLIDNQAYNAQRAGASAVVIVDNYEEVSESIIMGDDGQGFKVKIPSIFISQTDGTMIIEYLQGQERLGKTDR